MAHIKSYKELRVYEAAMRAAMRIFELTKRFLTEERYSLTDQIRKASRSVCANIGEAWRKRRYPAHFVSRLSDSEGEAEETRVWLEFSWRCGFQHKSLDQPSPHLTVSQSPHPRLPILSLRFVFPLFAFLFLWLHFAWTR
jgi:four helix bundle protein